MGLPANPNASTSVWTPDTYLYISTEPVSTGSPQPKNLLILAPMLNSAAALTGAPYSLTAGTADLNTVEQYTDVSLVRTKFGRRSLAAARFRGALQAQPVGLNIFLAAIAEPSNSNFAGVATQLLTFSGTVVGSGEVKIRACGYLHRIPVASGQTAAQVASTTHTQMGGTGGGTNPQQPDCPMVPGAIVSSVTVPLVFVHRGEVGNDKPIVVEIPPEITGLKVSPGIITIATNAAGDGGNPSIFTIRVGSQALTVSIAVGTTPANAATAIAAAINAATFPLSADTSTADLNLYYRSGWAVHRIQVSSTEDALGQTYTLKDRLNATHGAIDTSVVTTPGSDAFTALQGAGTPTLTTALANRVRVAPMLEWHCEYTDSTSLGAIYTHVEQYANGYYQENQRVTFASSEVLDATGSGLKNAKQRLTDPSPALTNSWRYEEVVSQDCLCQAGALAVQLAADLCAADLPYNFDGRYLAQGDIPILPPRADTDLDPATIDTAMRTYFLTIAKGDNGRVKIVRGVTAWGSSNREWSDFSYGRMFDDARYRMRQHLNNRFAGKVFFVGTTPRVDNAFTLDDVEEAIKEFLLNRDGITVDGAEDLARYVRAEVDGSFIRIACRLRVPREAHVKSGVISSAPALAA